MPIVLPPYLQALSKACHTMVFVDGCYQPALSTLEALPATVGYHAMDQGYHLDIPANLHIEKPFLWLHCLLNKNAAQSRIHQRMTLAENSQATCCAITYGLGDDHAHEVNEHIEVALKTDAKLDYSQLQAINHASCQQIQQTIEQAPGSTFQGCAAIIGGKQNRYHIDNQFAQEKACCILNGLYVLSDKQQLDQHLLMHHQTPECQSTQRYKGILSDAATAAFVGKVQVAPLAQKTQANQQNNTLLLGDHARATTQPILEIYADDIQCNHGATVGELDDQALFYLRTRGLDTLQAKQVLMQGFIQTVLDDIAHPDIRHAIMQSVQEKIHAL